MKRATRPTALTALALLLFAAALSASGCGERTGGTNAGTPSTGSSAEATSGEPQGATPPEAQTPIETAPASATQSGAAEKDGRYFAYLRTVETGAKGRVVADYAQFFTGDAAFAEAKKRGIPEVPNGFLIVNDNPKLRTLPLAANAAVRLASEAEGVRPEGYDIALDDFARSFIDGTIPQLQQVPYWITVKGGTVVRVEEQYLP